MKLGAMLLAATAMVGGALLREVSAASTGTGNGPAFCCCPPTHQTACNNVVINHSSHVDVTITVGAGSDTADNVATGQSGTAIASHTVPHGKCEHIQYTFSCVLNGETWACEFKSWTNVLTECP